MTRVGLLIVGSFALAGCNASRSDAPAVAAPSVQVAALPPAAPIVVSVTGVIATLGGSALDDADRRAAFDAELDAVSTGTRKSWRGQHGAYGFVESGAEQGGCRSYTHTVFVNGRPQIGQGSACRQPDSTWRVTS